MLYRVYFTARFAEYSRCFTDKNEAESFYRSISNCKSYRNVKLQIG